MCKTDTAKPSIGIKCKFSSHWLYNGTDEFCEDCSEKQKLACELLCKRNFYLPMQWASNPAYEEYKKYDDKLIAMLMNELD